MTISKKNRSIRVHRSSIFLMLFLSFFMPSDLKAEEIEDIVIEDIKEYSNPVEAQEDFQPVSFRVPDKEIIRAYKNQARFKYETPIQKYSEPNLFELFLIKLSGYLYSLLKIMPIRIILIVLGIVLLIAAILRLAKIDYKSLVSIKQEKQGINSYMEDVSLKESDFDKQINEAIENHDYRLAVRLLFIRNLKLLADKEIIKWNKYKTNSIYANEITILSMRKSYQNMSYVFDYVWYGEFSLSDADFSNIHQSMERLHKEIQAYA